MSWQNEKVLFLNSMRDSGEITSKTAKGRCTGKKIEGKDVF